jgi:hypothetical protein
VIGMQRPKVSRFIGGPWDGRTLADNPHGDSDVVHANGKWMGSYRPAMTVEGERVQVWHTTDFA